MEAVVREGWRNEYAGLEAKRMELQKKIEQFKRDEGLYNNQEWLKQSSADSMRVFACATKLAAIYRGIKARREVGPISSPKKGEKGHMRLSNFKDYAVNSADQVDDQSAHRSPLAARPPARHAHRALAGVRAAPFYPHAATRLSTPPALSRRSLARCALSAPSASSSSRAR